MEPKLTTITKMIEKCLENADEGLREQILLRLSEWTSEQVLQMCEERLDKPTQDTYRFN